MPQAQDTVMTEEVTGYTVSLNRQVSQTDFQTFVFMPRLLLSASLREEMSLLQWEVVIALTENKCLLWSTVPEAQPGPEDRNHAFTLPLPPQGPMTITEGAGECRGQQTGKHTV